MSNKRDQLVDLSNRFLQAFNDQSLEGVVSCFAEDGVYEDSKGGRHEGPDAIRTAFTPLLTGAMGKIHFAGEDLFVEEESGKVMASWRLSCEIEGAPVAVRGMDILQFRGDKLILKQAYMKAKAPNFEPN